MNNKGYFMTFWLYIWNSFIKNSFIYKILCSVYSFISASWKNSCITNWFRKNFFDYQTAQKSFIGKIVFSPFTLIDHICKLYYEKINAHKENSLILRTCKYFLHNILALNLRFIGAFLISAAFVNLVLSLVFKNSLISSIIVLVSGIVLSFFNYNVTDFLRGSFIFNFIEKCLGTKLYFNFYYVTKCSSGFKRILCAVLFGAVSGLICNFTSVIYAAAFALGLWFVFMVFYKVEFGVFITLFLAPILPTMAVVALTLLCLASLIVKALNSKKFEWNFDGLGVIISLMLVVYLFASITSFAPFKSIQIWAVYFAFMIFYFVIVNTIKSKEQLFNLLTVFSLSGLAVCIYGILQYIFGWNVTQAWMDEEMFEDIKMRIYSTLENPNVLGEYILLVLPISISLMWTKKNILPKLFYALISLIMAVALILTFSRGCWIGIMASAAIFITFVAGKLWGLALLALPFVPMIMPESIINRFMSIGDMKDSSTSYRVYIWMGTLLMLKDFWLTGVGLGTEAFTQVYPFYSYSSIVAPHAHNMFLQIMVESGIIGIVMFLFLIFMFVKKLIDGYQYVKKDSELSVLIVGIAAAVFGFLVQGLFDNCFYNYRVFMIFWAVIAIGIAAVYVARSDYNSKEADIND